MTTSRGFVRAAAAVLAVVASTGAQGTPPRSTAGVPMSIGNVRVSPAGAVALFTPIEISFDVHGAQATNLQWPYDPASPPGIPHRAGISVDAVFTSPDGRRFAQPAFVAQSFIEGIREGRDWRLPTGRFAWHVRFSPNRVGAWSVALEARDRGGRVQQDLGRFDVVPSAQRGFVRVSTSDPRYFEFEDGTLFTGLGFQFPEFLEDPVTKGRQEYERLRDFGVNFVRVSIASIYGSAWNTWIGGRNQYRGTLPVTGLVPVPDRQSDDTILSLRLDYEPEGDVGWFDACRMQFWDDPESIEPYTRYRIRVEYRASGIAGPRNPAFGGYGLAVKLGGWHPNCYEPTAGTRVTPHGLDADGWSAIEADWISGSSWFLPRMYLALENVTGGVAYVRSVSLRRRAADGSLGPELMIRPSMQHHTYVPEEKARAFDHVVRSAEAAGVRLKVVVGEKNDKVFTKLGEDGRWLHGGDNADGYYGLGRRMNATRWLQQAWWRYLQARWGYSTSIHSWELLNEADPDARAHFEMADEFGKFMHCRVFGVEPGSGDAAPCRLRHPNAHMVTTSLWRGFPAEQFWASARYPNIDYADLHAYVSTSDAPRRDRERMTTDPAYYHLWHSRAVAGRVAKPVVRGEAGLDGVDEHSSTALTLERDRTGTWLHDFLWAGLDGGGLYELYWWRHHIWNDSVDHRPAYKAIAAFLADIPLNRGGYVPWGGTVSNPRLLVVGQKHPRKGLMHLWVRDGTWTWSDVAGGSVGSPQSGEVRIGGFVPLGQFTLERWNTRTPGGRVQATERVLAGADGWLTIQIDALAGDVALKLRPADEAHPPSTSRPGGVEVSRE